MALETKICTKCKKEKPTSSFSKQKGADNGIRSKCKECCNKESKVDWASKRRNLHLVKTYGITEAEYDTLFILQGGLCAICRHPAPNNRELDVDHCHLTGKVRGLLCWFCNRGLGCFKDNASLLLQAIQYLSREDCMTQEKAQRILSEFEALGMSPAELEIKRQELYSQFLRDAELSADRCGDPDDYDFTGAIRGKYHSRYQKGVAVHITGDTNDTPPPGYTKEEWEACCTKWDAELDWVEAVETAGDTDGDLYTCRSCTRLFQRPDIIGPDNPRLLGQHICIQCFSDQTDPNPDGYKEE